MQNLNQINGIITKSPGKCLLCGGYLILNKKNNGVVINIDSFMKCESKLIPNKECMELNEIITLEIYSFYTQSLQKYHICYNNEKLFIKTDSEINKWIYYSVQMAFYLYFLEFPSFEVFQKCIGKIYKCYLSIKGDYRFYSYKEANQSAESGNIKTGLGSSSALISSICSNIIIFLSKIDTTNKNVESNNCIRSINDQRIKSLIVLSSLLANNLAQNKIGSGFDILSSILGSQIFHQYLHQLNFDAPLLINQNNKIRLDKFLDEYEKTYLSQIKFLSHNQLFTSQKFSFFISLISIESGSDTRIFVKKVTEYAKLKMKKELFDDPLFSKLTEINKCIISIFDSSTNELNIQNLKQLCIQYRKVIKEISHETEVEIEPKIFASLLDNLISKDSIIFAICPGAGGFDNIAVLGYGNTDTKRNKFDQQVQDCVDLYNKDIGIANNFKAYIIKANIVNNGTNYEII